MKREIEFRGQRADNKEWVYGDLVRIPDGDSFECYIISDFDERDSIYDLWKYAIKVIPETVGQYVGVKDKNGKKIFEGDIVKILSEPKDCNFVKIEDFGVVQYDEDFAEYIIGFENVRFGEEESLGNFRDGFCEVIGNIFDKGNEK